LYTQRGRVSPRFGRRRRKKEEEEEAARETKEEKENKCDEN
jgi:hypothetical protein